LLPLLIALNKGSVKVAYEGAKIILKKAAGYVTIMALCLFLHSYFKTAAAGYLSATTLYPISQGGGLVLSIIMTTLCFKEKLTLKCLFGICIAFLGVLLINLKIFL
jgi:multidrug transporter EmrE-like cation transporter